MHEQKELKAHGKLPGQQRSEAAAYALLPDSERQAREVVCLSPLICV